MAYFFGKQKDTSDNENNLPFQIDSRLQSIFDSYECQPAPAASSCSEANEEFYANYKIPLIICSMQNSYQIMLIADNPQSLCTSYYFMTLYFDDLLYYMNQGYFDDEEILDAFQSMLSRENHLKLIYQCYQKYIAKAHRELKKKDAINRQIDMFWRVIQNNVDMDMYLESRSFTL